MKPPTSDQTRPLVQLHLNRYGLRHQRYLAGNPGYTAENALYLKLWEGIQKKDCDWTKLSAAERAEVREALEDEN